MQKKTIIEAKKIMHTLTSSILFINPTKIESKSLDKSKNNTKQI